MWGIKQSFIIVIGFIGIIVLLGLLTNDKTDMSSWSWAPNPSNERLLNRDTLSSSSKVINYGKGVDYPPRDKGEAWDEFLEDIDNRGLQYTDPDAEEIWETNYK